MAAYLSRKSRGCSAIGRPVPSPTPTTAGKERRREKPAPLRNDPPHLSHSIRSDCRDDVRSALDFNDKAPIQEPSEQNDTDVGAARGLGLAPSVVKKTWCKFGPSRPWVSVFFSDLLFGDESSRDE